MRLMFFISKRVKSLSCIIYKIYVDSLLFYNRAFLLHHARLLLSLAVTPVVDFFEDLRYVKTTVLGHHPASIRLRGDLLSRSNRPITSTFDGRTDEQAPDHTTVIYLFRTHVYAEYM